MEVLEGSGGSKDRIACHTCLHYQVTWDLNFPYGCRAHAFKSRRNPALEVRSASGIACMLFAPKQPRDPEDRNGTLPD